MQKSENSDLTKKLAILASGRGSNARAILDYFSCDDHIEVALIVSNNPDAGVLQLADDHGVESMVIDRIKFRDTTYLDDKLEELRVDLVVLAGFLWLIPERLLQKYPGKIVNIHPALLPKYGGKGMFGLNVHQAVKDAGDKESGITIHLIDEQYDRGKAVFQARVAINPEESAEEIAAKVLKLEHYHYPRVIEQLLFSN
jgi:phosphoribosylglycinamide formyltransferase-1